MVEYDLRSFLDGKYEMYNTQEFIIDDPVSIPHGFYNPADIEISGFITALLSWGQRKTIIKNARMLFSRMGESPYQFLIESNAEDLKSVSSGFVHRTFNQTDCFYILNALKNLYLEHKSMHQLFTSLSLKHSHQMDKMISEFRSVLFSYKEPGRTRKHVADPMSNSSAKRICMFLRWMVRKDPNGVDFGIWSGIDTANLMCPLDVHSGRVARKLGLLNRSQNDWKAVLELTENLKKLDPKDPVKYDYALFGLGVHEVF